MSTDDPALYGLAANLGQQLFLSGSTVAVAESCTGGWLAKAITDVAGSSQWFDRGFVTYTNAAKQELLGVSAQTLSEHGAVSEATVREMVAGVFAHSHASLAAAISGIAGPGGAVPDKPVGTVCFAWGRAGAPPHVRTRHFEGDREAVRRQATRFALEVLIDELATRLA